MIRGALFVSLLSAAAITGVAPIPKDDDAARLARSYGTKFDPQRDAAFDLTGDALRISIPKRERAPRAFGPLGGETPKIDPATAPRVWRDVEGDFTVTVRVTFPLTFAKTKAESGLRAAGLVVWASEQEHLLLARVEWVNGKPLELFYLLHNSKFKSSSETENQDPVANSGFVRLERRGEEISSYYSRDTKEWTKFVLVRKLKATGPLKIGVFSTHATDDPFEVLFDQYTLTTPKK